MDIKAYLVGLLSFLSWIQVSLGCEGGGGGPDYEKMAEQEKQKRLQELRLWCTNNCVSEWQAWSHCSVPCGKGSRTRRRTKTDHSYCKELGKFTCPHTDSQNAPCNAGCPHGGWISGNGCACPVGRKGRCCNEEIHCSFPGRPENGRITNSWPAKVNSRATFSCEEGFAMQGDDQTVCKENGHWSRPVPKCLSIQCVSDVHNVNVVVLNPKDGYAYEESIIFECKEGYKLYGPESRTCQHGPGNKGKWSDYEPRCKPIKCPDPGFPENGDREGHSLTFGSKVTFTCTEGYKLLGSSSLQCLASGTWFGRIPKCEQITCEAPLVPKNGNVQIRKSRSGSVAIFSCDNGYLLQPDAGKVLKCTEDGVWNTTEPTCKSISCGAPTVPEHTNKDGNIYDYPYNITYSCQDGYQLEGQSVSMCQATGHWSAKPPKCKPCPKNTFMSSDGKCSTCPKGSQTAVEASTSVKMCTCQTGYTGPHGGPCVEVRCGPILAPDKGTISKCGDRVGDMCVFTCSPGYVLQKGSATRTCQPDGNWEGTDALCEPCPIDTYKNGERACLPCPANSHTNAPAQILSGCVCNFGYKGPNGGTCEDINECKANNGKGPCQDVCENEPGSYECECSVPGYVVDPANTDLCRLNETCRNLTIDDAPVNGGIICHWYRTHNTQHCDVKCNPGFELADRVNNYETCGSSTNYIWSYQLEDKTNIMTPCIEEFFPGFRFEGDTSYFVVNCEDLNEEQQIEVKEIFAKKLNDEGVCQKSVTKLCDIKDMGIICGRRNETRRKRGVDYNVQSVDFGFNISALQRLSSDDECGQDMCKMLRLPKKYCTKKRCITVYNRFIKAAVRVARSQLERLYSPEEIQKMVFDAVNREFDPEKYQGTDFKVDCEKGMRSSTDGGKCIPCVPGTYLDSEVDNCLACPAGTYQDEYKAIECKKCAPGYTTYKNSSTLCIVCKAGFYGQDCALECNCVAGQGHCDPLSGKCMCLSGYEGDKCQHDIPGCRDGGCYPGVACSDRPAPEMGFTCGKCPAGTHGDGAVCMDAILS